MNESNKDIDRAISIFDQHKREILSFDVLVSGHTSTMYLLREIMFDDHDIVDYEGLIRRMRRLPGLIAFYSTLKKQAERQLQHAQDTFEAWYSKLELATNKNMLKELRDGTDYGGKALPTTLMKAPTVGQVRSRVLADRLDDYRKEMKTVEEAQDRVNILGTLLKSLEKASYLLLSESRMLETLINHGIEHVRSHPRSRYNNPDKTSTEPKNEDAPDDGMGGESVG